MLTPTGNLVCSISPYMRQNAGSKDGPDTAVTRVPGGGVIRREFYRPTLRENLVTMWEGLALRFSTSQVLIVGPYVGEFGHEIMDFQSYVRRFFEFERNVCHRVKRVRIVLSEGKRFGHDVRHEFDAC